MRILLLTVAALMLALVPLALMLPSDSVEVPQKETRQQLTDEPGGVLPRQIGWYEDQRFNYYDFGVGPAEPSDMWFFYFNSTGQLVPGQDAVVNQTNAGVYTEITNPDPGYSDFRRIQQVWVPDNYSANTIRSVADILSSGFTITSSNDVINCPAVPRDSTIGQFTQPQREWYEGAEHFCFPFETNNQSLADMWPLTSSFVPDLYDAGNNSIKLAPLWKFTDSGSAPIIDAFFGDAGYTPLWVVALLDPPAGYLSDSIRSADNLTDAQRNDSFTTMFVNCPVFNSPTPVEHHTVEPAGSHDLVRGWYQDMEIAYYDFGPSSPTPAPLWQMQYANGTAVAGQFDIVDDVEAGVFTGVATDTNYSDFHRVQIVTVPDDYNPNWIKSRQDLEASGYPVTTTDTVLNSPLVPRDSVLVNDTLARTAVTVWYETSAADMFVFETNNATVSVAAGTPYVADLFDGTEVITAPIYASPLAGQRNIVDVVPGDAGYSPLWAVQTAEAPADSEANTVRSLANLSAWTLADAGLAVNCPVVGDPLPVAIAPDEPVGAVTVEESSFIPAPPLLLLVSAVLLSLILVAGFRNRRTA